jgi:hypothetical protein
LSQLPTTGSVQDMENKATTKIYTAPEITDFGTVEELTGTCVFGSGGDAAFPSGTGGGLAFGTSSKFGNCHSS